MIGTKGNTVFANEDSTLYKMATGAMNGITVPIVSYNITFKPDEGQSIADSYIQLGPVCDAVKANATWL